MNKRNILSIDAKSQIDAINKKILQTLQEDFPIVQKPWKMLSQETGIPENELFSRIEYLCNVGVIQKIGPIVDSTKIGLAYATLVALIVPEDQVDAVAAVINQYSNVSHNYEREHKYNVWFTLAAKSREELDHILNEIIQKTGLSPSDVLNLPTTQRFKINVKFSLSPK